MSIPHSNIKLEYQYRDGGNYKNWGEIVFTNSKSRSLAEVEKLVDGFLIDSEFFYSQDWDVPDFHFEEYPWDDEIDHDWHQFQKLSETTEDASYDLEEFLNKRHPLREEWERITRPQSQISSSK